MQHVDRTWAHKGKKKRHVSHSNRHVLKQECEPLPHCVASVHSTVCLVVARLYYTTYAEAGMVLWAERNVCTFRCQMLLEAGSQLFHLLYMLGISRDPWSMWLRSQLGPLLFTRPFKIERVTRALGGRQGMEWFWHLFRVLYGFTPHRCLSDINFSWVGLKNKAQPKGLRLSGTQMFWNKASGHHRPQHGQSAYALQLHPLTAEARRVEVRWCPC